MEKNEFFFNDLIPTFENNFLMELNKINSEEEIYKEYYIKLKFPDYFGFNWDALHDCLSDLSWINENNIIIYHQTVPLLNKNDLKIYLKILNDAIKLWKNYEEHNFYVFFKEKDRLFINQFTSIVF